MLTLPGAMIPGLLFDPLLFSRAICNRMARFYFEQAWESKKQSTKRAWKQNTPESFNASLTKGTSVERLQG
jgi:hypothetical protein